MSKFNIYFFSKLLSLSLGLVTRILGYVTTIRDLLDDGVVNGSIDEPAWLGQLEEICASVDELGTDLTRLRRDVNDTEIVD